MAKRSERYSYEGDATVSCDSRPRKKRRIDAVSISTFVVQHSLCLLLLLRHDECPFHCVHIHFRVREMLKPRHRTTGLPTIGFSSCRPARPATPRPTHRPMSLFLPITNLNRRHSRDRQMVHNARMRSMDQMEENGFTIYCN